MKKYFKTIKYKECRNFKLKRQCTKKKIQNLIKCNISLTVINAMKERTKTL